MPPRELVRSRYAKGAKLPVECAHRYQEPWRVGLGRPQTGSCCRFIRHRMLPTAQTALEEPAER